MQLTNRLASPQGAPLKSARDRKPIVVQDRLPGEDLRGVPMVQRLRQAPSVKIINLVGSGKGVKPTFA